MRAKQKKDFRSHRLISNITIVLVGITTISSIIISNINNKANAVDANSTATIRVKSTCSMTATVDTAHTASLINGIYSGDYVDTTDNNNKPYENGIGQTTIQTFCNDPYGYAIYAIGYTGGDEGVANNRNTVLHSNTLANAYDIPTGTATSGDTSNWAMKLTSITGDFELDILSDSDGSYANYHKIPASYTKVAQYDNGTDPTVVSASLTTTYAAYISNTQPAGTYEGQVKYVLVHPNTDLGPDHNTMQDVEIWGSSIAIGQEVTTYDARDGKPYTVRRMCMDGAGNTWQEKEMDCNNSMLWMTQNLDLDLDSSFAFSSEDTNLTNESLTGAYVDGYTIDENNVIYWTPANSTITSIDSSVGKFDGFTDKNYNPVSADPDGGIISQWYATSNPYSSNLCYVNPTNNQTCNYLKSNNATAFEYFQAPPFTSGFNTSGDHTKIGNYYNWSAAIASNDSSNIALSSNAQNSICPKGWRLPMVSYGTNNDFDGLSGYGPVANPTYMVRAGYVDGYRLNRAGQWGYLWSSSIDQEISAKGAYFALGSFVTTSYSASRYMAFSIRCVSDY